jgi:hypothetical protein
MGYTHLAACDREGLSVFLLSHASRLPVLPSGANLPADHDGRIERKVGIGHLLTYPLGSDLGGNNGMAGPPGSPWFLIEALGINDHGQIAGPAFNTSTGDFHGYLATPAQDGDSASPSSTPSTPTNRPKVVLPKDVRRLLQRRSPTFGRMFNR